MIAEFAGRGYVVTGADDFGSRTSAYGRSAAATARLWIIKSPVRNYSGE